MKFCFTSEEKGKTINIFAFLFSMAKPEMDLANFLLILLIIFPSFAAFPYTTSARDQPNDPTIEPLLLQACVDVEDHNSCLTNVQMELSKMGSAGNPSSILSAALKASLNEARAAMQTITRFSSLSISYREQVAIEDCKELLDFSVSELAWSLGEMRKIRSGSTNFHYEGNLKAWLSAALSNQDTCLEGFEGTDRRLERFMQGSLRQVTQLIGNVLELYTQLHSLPFQPPRDSAPATNQTSEFPSWMADEDQDLLKSTRPQGMHVDAVVAADGSGQYRTITEAVNEAPSYSLRRYIIYVKKGVYRENIDMKRKKTNIMFVGDGIGQTVVTADRNFLQGWTTFRTATVGKCLNSHLSFMFWQK